LRFLTIISKIIANILSTIHTILSNWAKRPPKVRVLQAAMASVVAAAAAIILLALYIFIFVVPNLPAITALTEYHPKIPLRVYTADRVLIGEFGEERRDFVPIAKIPASLKNAVIAIEDNNFYDHGGVDFLGIVRAGLANLWRSKSQGASTITMQVARTFLLTRKKTYSRKLHEIILAYRIEDELSKDQILELYMNQIYLGERAFGFGSAARIYFGKDIQDLTIAESAMLAGLPKAPSSNNPVVNPKRATQRQRYVLKRMHELGFITSEEYQQALAEKLHVLQNGNALHAHAEYAAENVRQFMLEQYKDDTYTSGFNVYTTIDSKDQEAAYTAVRSGVLDYDRRHGYRGPEAFIDLSSNEEDRQQEIEETLQKHPDSDELLAAVVTSVTSKAIHASLRSGDDIEISGAGLRFAASSLSSKAAKEKKIRPGAVIRVVQDKYLFLSFAHLPVVSAALVSLYAKDCSILAMVGGFDYSLGQFDHVTQAWRQPGSAIKPFIYSAALDRGFSPGTIINDAPLLTEEEAAQDDKAWNPGNDDGQYDGPITMRTGLKKSKNLVSIRILRKITPPYARDYLSRFGFDPDKQPNNLTLTLGTGSVTPLQEAGAFSVFANGGYKVAPYLIQKVTDAKGNVLLEANHPKAGDQAIRVIDPRNAFIMTSMLRDVVRSGTGYMASQKLGRADLAGKTGTTDNSVDGWFAGFARNTVAVSWMGYDQPRSLGSHEFGSTVALPIWIDYMRVALRGQPVADIVPPPGLTQVDGDWMYSEYVDSVTAVKSLDVDDKRGFWERLFNPQPRTPTEQEEKQQRMEDLYGG
jgi:penicillin-binding protein 1A